MKPHSLQSRPSPPAAAGCPAIFDLPVAGEVIADPIGVTRQTLSRTFARWRKEGVIRVVGVGIHVLDDARLRACAENTA